jgi:hypothetical protein
MCSASHVTSFAATPETLVCLRVRCTLAPFPIPDIFSRADDFCSIYRERSDVVVDRDME